jgi:hypothetical protein
VALTEVALLVGIAGSLFVADRVRKQTFDMEPAEIATRYQHHDAMLHAVRESAPRSCGRAPTRRPGHPAYLYQLAPSWLPDT